MAKISHDDTSWNARGVKRRDFRHTHDGPDVGKGKKKNTKKWCKGHVGKEHMIETIPWRGWNNVPSLAWVVDKCQNCGKEMSFRRNTNL